MIVLALTCLFLAALYSKRAIHADYCIRRMFKPSQAIYACLSLALLTEVASSNKKVFYQKGVFTVTPQAYNDAVGQHGVSLFYFL